MTRARTESPRLYDSLGRRNGWITRRAREQGKDPARVFAALKGSDTKRKAVEHAARVHGERARVKTESRLTPAQKAKRTRDANRIERAKAERLAIAEGRGDREDLEREESSGFDPGEEYSLDDMIDRDGDYDDYDDYDVETSPDYEMTGK